MNLFETASKLEIEYLTITLRNRGGRDYWQSPLDGRLTSVENAVLDHFRTLGWRGFAGEGGLLLNLLKAMSFQIVSERHRSIYVEALYSQNVAFECDRFSSEYLLNNVKSANLEQVIRNFGIMASKHEINIIYDGVLTVRSRSSMLDFFPGLEQWMFAELFKVAGVDLLHSIAQIFSIDPYEFRKGWPDITMWNNGVLHFVEVKAPGDKMRPSQKRIIENFAKPLNLNFYLAEVIIEPSNDNISAI